MHREGTASLMPDFKTTTMQACCSRHLGDLPSFAAQRIDDVSLFLNQKVPDKMGGFLISYHNVNELYGSLGYKVLERGTNIKETRPLWPLWLAFLTLIAWGMAGFAASYLLLSRRERQ
jgi:hypothetical protein